MNGNTHRQEALFLAAALSAPLAQAASGCSWAAVLAVGGLCLLTLWGVEKLGSSVGPWLGAAQGLWSCLVLSQVLRWSTSCWPDYSVSGLIVLVLLALTAWSAGKGTAPAARVGCALVRPVGFFLAVVLLSGAADGNWTNLRPTWQMPHAALIPVLLLPALDRRALGGGVRALPWVLVLGLAVSAVSGVVLSPAVRAGATSPIYELSRSVSLFGRIQRFESLMAAALTMGYFATASWVLRAQKELLPGKGTLPITTALTAALYCSGWSPDSRLLALGSIVLWVVLPMLAGFRKFFQDQEIPS